MKRNPFIYAAAVLAVMVLGLLSRRFPDFLPAALGKYPGDALWALMIFCGLGFLRPKLPTTFTAITALAFACAVEFLKFYQSPWLESVRATLPGRLMLGSVFSWKNIAAYAIGIFFGWAVETGIKKCLIRCRPPRQ